MTLCSSSGIKAPTNVFSDIIYLSFYNFFLFWPKVQVTTQIDGLFIGIKQRIKANNHTEMMDISQMLPNITKSKI